MGSLLAGGFEGLSPKDLRLSPLSLLPLGPLFTRGWSGIIASGALAVHDCINWAALCPFLTQSPEPLATGPRGDKERQHPAAHVPSQAKWSVPNWSKVL